MAGLAFACDAAPRGRPVGVAQAALEPVALEPGARVARVAAPNRIDEKLLASLSAPARAAIAKAKLPVFAPASPLSAFVVIAEEHFVAFTGTRDRTLQDGQVSRATLSLHGTHVVHDIEGLQPAKPSCTVHGQGAQFTINEGIATVTWEEFGVGYALDVECSDHSDSRCHDDKFVVSEADQLRLVGGAK